MQALPFELWEQYYSPMEGSDLWRSAAREEDSVAEILYTQYH
jgi:hypothetical protein